jgi:hypothetical protein
VRSARRSGRQPSCLFEETETMNTIKLDQTQNPSVQRVRRLALGLILGASAALGAVLSPAFRRRVAATGTALAVGVSSLLVAQPAAAAGTYYVDVEFDEVRFAKIDDGCSGWLCMDTITNIDVYGSLHARTSATGGGPWNWSNRNFGTWGKDPWSCPAQAVAWDSTTYGPCLKKISDDSNWIDNADPHAFKDVLLCGGTSKDTCGTIYSKNNNHIVLVVHPGETITVNVAMQDYDQFSANDTVCTSGAAFGPFDSSQLASLFLPSTIHMADNGNAECLVKFHLHTIGNP